MPLPYENYIFLINGIYFLTIYFTIATLASLTQSGINWLIDSDHPIQPAESPEEEIQPPESPEEEIQPPEVQAPETSEEGTQNSKTTTSFPTTVNLSTPRLTRHTKMLRNIVQDQTILENFTIQDDPNPPPRGVLTIVFDNELYKDAILRCLTPEGFRLNLMLTQYYGPPSPETWQMRGPPITAIVHDAETPLNIFLKYEEESSPEEDSESS